MNGYTHPRRVPLSIDASTEVAKIDHPTADKQGQQLFGLYPQSHTTAEIAACQQSTGKSCAPSGFAGSQGTAPFSPAGRRGEGVTGPLAAERPLILTRWGRSEGRGWGPTFRRRPAIPFARRRSGACNGENLACSRKNPALALDRVEDLCIVAAVVRSGGSASLIRS